MSDSYTIGSTHQIGDRSYVVTPESDEVTVWLRLADTDIETPISRMLLSDGLMDAGAVLDRQIDAYYAGQYPANPIGLEGIER